MLEIRSGTRRKLCSQLWWHFKNRGQRSACPVLWWPSSVSWMTHHRISSTAPWRPAGIPLSFFPWYTVMALQSKRVSSDASVNMSHVKWKESIFSRGLQSSEAYHLYIWGPGWWESRGFLPRCLSSVQGGLPEEVLQLLYQKTIPSPHFFTSWASLSLIFGHHLARPWSSQPKHRHEPLSLFPLKNEGHPYQPPETTHSTLSACWNPTHPLRSISPATSPGLSQLGMSSLTPVPQVIWSIPVCSSSHFDLHVVINVLVPFGRLSENPLNGPKGLPDAKWAVTIVSVPGKRREMSTFWEISCLL